MPSTQIQLIHRRSQQEIWHQSRGEPLRLVLPVVQITSPDISCRAALARITQRSGFEWIGDQKKSVAL